MINYEAIIGQLWLMNYRTLGPDGTGFGTERLDQWIENIRCALICREYDD